MMDETNYKIKYTCLDIYQYLPILKLQYPFNMNEVRIL